MPTKKLPAKKTAAAGPRGGVGFKKPATKTATARTSRSRSRKERHPFGTCILQGECICQ